VSARDGARLIGVGGKLEGLLPSRIDIVTTGSPTTIKIGVSQIIERPLHQIDIEQSASDDLAVYYDFPDLAQSLTTGRNAPYSFTNSELRTLNGSRNFYPAAYPFDEENGPKEIL